MKHSRTRHNERPATDAPESMAALAEGMADDFNNILTTVMGACSLIDRDQPANDELLQYVRLIRASAEHAAMLSDRLVRASSAAGHTAEATIRIHNGVRIPSTYVDDKKKFGDIVSSNNSTGGISS